MKSRIAVTHACRFWDLVDIRGIDECWPWLGNTDEGGYGRTFTSRDDARRRRRVPAHVFAWLSSNGVTEVPAGQIITHSCDNPPCCNPMHLSAGTHLSNAMEREQRGRSRRLFGEENRAAKLTEDDVRRARHAIDAGAKLRPLAREMGISISTLCSIKARRTWANIFAAAMVCAFLGSCGGDAPAPIVTAVTLPPAPKVAPPRPAPVELRSVQFVPVQLDDSDQAVACLDAKGYQALAFNMSSILRWMVQASDVMDFYEQDAKK